MKIISPASLNKFIAPDTEVHLSMNGNNLVLLDSAMKFFRLTDKPDQKLYLLLASDCLHLYIAITAVATGAWPMRWEPRKGRYMTAARPLCAYIREEMAIKDGVSFRLKVGKMVEVDGRNFYEITPIKKPGK